MKSADDRKHYRTTLIVSAPARSEREHTAKLAEVAAMIFQDYGMSVYVSTPEQTPKETKR